MSPNYRQIHEKVIVHRADISKLPISELAGIFKDQQAVINTAGNVSQGQKFVDLVDRIVAGLEAVPETARPVCWFLAGAGLLDIDGRGRKGVDFPMIGANYWPHRSNFDRIRRTDLDWRILCPGPMTDQRPLGLARMRVSLDLLPVEMPDETESLPEPAVLRLFGARMPEMTVSYKDAASLMLANIAPNGEMSRHRVGLALPVGMNAK